MFYKTETILDKRPATFGRTLYLAHVAAGEEIAGSGTRKVEECYRVISLHPTHPRRSEAFRTLAEAQQRFECLTTPIVEIPA